eukprot:10363504-Prorocentrum_lima.AAC.1
MRGTPEKSKSDTVYPAAEDEEDMDETTAEHPHKRLRGKTMVRARHRLRRTWRAGRARGGFGPDGVP